MEKDRSCQIYKLFFYYQKFAKLISFESKRTLKYYPIPEPYKGLERSANEDNA